MLSFLWLAFQNVAMGQVDIPTGWLHVNCEHPCFPVPATAGYIWFLAFAAVTCFPALVTPYMISRACNYLLRFPVLVGRYLNSRAYDQVYVFSRLQLLHVFPPLPPVVWFPTLATVTCFPALATVCMIFRACNCCMLSGAWYRFEFVISRACNCYIYPAPSALYML